MSYNFNNVAAAEGTTTCANCGLEFSSVALFCPNCGTAKSRDFDGDPLVGALVGDRFLIQERMGHGGSGTLYRAEHVTLRRKVAVKVLHDELSRDDLAIERFRREATTVSEIDNEHIVEIHDFGRTSDGRLYLAMELLDGETLDEKLDREKRLDTEQVVDILIQLGDALIEAHAIGYIHRDLRPRNIFLANRRGRSNFVKLLDFGLAKLVEQEGEAATTSLGMTFGEPKYMSPEQARGDAVDRRADIYSMGCIAYEMLVGEPPFVGGRVFDILTRHVETMPRPVVERRPDVPPWLDAAVMRMLEKRAEDRFTTVYRLVAALRQGLATGEIMPAAIARRRWTEPPASVSREMQRIGMVEAGNMLDTERTAPPIMKTVPAGLVNRADLSAPVARAGSVSQRDEDEDDLRKTIRRDSSPVSSPVSSPASSPVSSPSTARRAFATGKNRAAARDSAGISAAWYADGDTDQVGELDESQRRELSRARVPPSASRADIGDADLYYDEPRRTPLFWTLGGLGAVALIIVVAMFAWPSGSKKAKPGQSDNSANTANTANTNPANPDPANPTNPANNGSTPALASSLDAGVVAVASPDAAPSAAPAKDHPPKRPAVATSRHVRPRTAPRSHSHSRSQPAPRTTPSNPWPSDKPPRTSHRTPPTPPDSTSKPKPKPSAAKTKADFYAKVGKRALANGDVLGAAKAFNDARKLDKNNVDAITGLGEIALSQGAYSAAIGHLRRASRMRSRSARIHTLLGEAYLSAGRNKSAASSFKRALRINPDSARARNGYNDASGRIPPPPEDPS